ncbi:hypothetical protein GcM3_224046, partial [Golovinomyces cichoracearum]
SRSYNLPCVGPDPYAYRKACGSQIRKCIECIFDSTEWCSNYFGKRHSVVTAWSSRFLDILARVDDIKGIYKNRLVSEGICILLVACALHRRTFLPVDLNQVLQNLGMEYMVLENVSHGMKWAVYLTQINVIIMTPDAESRVVRASCNSECTFFENDVSIKFTSAFRNVERIQLVSTMVDITNEIARDRCIWIQPDNYEGTDSYNMELTQRFSVERYVYDGPDPSDDWRVKAIGHSKLNMDNTHKMTVSSMREL